MNADERKDTAAGESLGGICLSVLAIGNEQVKQGRIHEGLELCGLADKLS